MITWVSDTVCCTPHNLLNNFALIHSEFLRCHAARNFIQRKNAGVDKNRALNLRHAVCKNHCSVKINARGIDSIFINIYIHNNKKFQLN
jgi:hypothetical protein